MEEAAIPLERMHRQTSRLAAEWIAQPMAMLWKDLLQQAEAHSLDDYPTQIADLHALRQLVQMEGDWLARLRGALENRALAWPRLNPMAQGTPALSLMSELELAIQLQAQHLVTEVTRRMSPQAARLDARMALLGDRLGVRPEAGNPWGVEGVVRAFVETLPIEELTPTLVPTLFTRLATVLPEALRAAWPKVLARLDALPEVQMTEPESAPASAPAWVPEGGIVAHAPAAVEPLPRAMLDADVDARPPAQAAARSGVADGGEEALFGLEASQAAERGATAGTGGVAQPDGMPRYRDLVRDRLARWREQARREEPVAVPIRAHEFRTSEVLTVAHMLQGEDPSPFARALTASGTQGLQWVIRDEMLKAAGQIGFDAGNARFARDEEDAIDLVALLFSTLARDNRLMPEGERMFAKLVLPYVKLAVTDDSLFNNRTHPARRLLDALTEACDGNDGETVGNREALERAGRVVDQLVTRFREDQALFELAVQELRDFLDQQRQRAELAEKRQAEALHGRERLQFARRAAGEATRACVGKGPLAAGTRGFLETYWQKSLEQSWLRHGEDSSRHRALLGLGDTLRNLDAAAAAMRGSELAKGFFALLPLLRECLAFSGCHGAMAEEAIARLLREMTQADAERLQREARIFDAPDVADVDSGLHGVDGEPVEADPVLVARVARLRAGQGLRFREADGRESAGRIAWISPLTSRLLVVDRRGAKRLVCSPAGLAAMIEQGKVAIRAVEAPVDHAMRQVWNELQAVASR